MRLQKTDRNVYQKYLYGENGKKGVHENWYGEIKKNVAKKRSCIFIQQIDQKKNV